MKPPKEVYVAVNADGRLISPEIIESSTDAEAFAFMKGDTVHHYVLAGQLAPQAQAQETEREVSRLLALALFAGCHDRCCTQDCVRKHREWVKGGCESFFMAGDVPVFSKEDCFVWKCDEYTACSVVADD